MPYKKTTVEIDEDLYKRFEEVYPDGTLKWFVNACLEEFTRLHDPTYLDREISTTVKRALVNHGEDAG